MEVFRWIGTHWFDLLQSAGIISGFLFTAHTIRRDAETRRITNMIELGKQHTAIWKQLTENPDLARVTDETVSLDTDPVSQNERRFVTALILHLDAVYQAMNAKMFVNLDGLHKDIATFFALPIPKAVWQSVKPFQNRDFVRFVEDSIGASAQ